jgi:hypothetical protein
LFKFHAMKYVEVLNRGFVETYIFSKTYCNSFSKTLIIHEKNHKTNHQREGVCISDTESCLFIHKLSVQFSQQILYPIHLFFKLLKNTK